jgi:hypothetical protein
MAAGIRIGAVVASVLATSILVWPGYAQAPTPNPVSQESPPPLTDAALDAAFQCPEILANEDLRRQALLDYFHWAQIRHPNWSRADTVEFKKKLLIRHQCADSLRDLADYAKHGP